jgi:hypothetical protein
MGTLPGGVPMYPPTIVWLPGQDYGWIYYLDSNSTNDEIIGYSIPKSFIDNGLGASFMWTQVLFGQMSNFHHNPPLISYLTRTNQPLFVIGENYFPDKEGNLITYNATDGTKLVTNGGLGIITGYSALNLDNNTSILYVAYENTILMGYFDFGGSFALIGNSISYVLEGLLAQTPPSADSFGTVYLCLSPGAIWGINSSFIVSYQLNVSRPVGCRGAIPTNNGLLVNWANGAVGYYSSAAPQVPSIMPAKGLSTTDAIILGCVIGGLVIIAVAAIYYFKCRTGYSSLS